ncbi:hypothetical protein JCM10213v2_007381 [Rhodosporidiobolus nylandii]
MPLPRCLTISPMDLADVPACAALERLAFAPTTFAKQLFPLVSASSYEAWRRGFFSSGVIAREAGHPHVLLVAKMDGEIAGVGWWQEMPPAPDAGRKRTSCSGWPYTQSIKAVASAAR